jgi:hypothetical protein
MRIQLPPGIEGRRKPRACRRFPTILSIVAMIALPLLLLPYSSQADGEPVQRLPFSGARWIGFGDPAVTHRGARVAFRRRLELPEDPVTAPVRVTADSRYILWVNGEFVGRGPARVFPWAQPYDEYDVAPFLRAGTKALREQGRT